MGSQQVIVNELLAYIQNAIDTMDELSVLHVCKSNFKEEDICSGKALLFQTLGKTAQMPSRRREGGEKSLQDIITLFKETDPDDVPAFAAQQLHLLPAVDFQHIDVSRFLKDIKSLKSSLADVHSKLEASDKTISLLRAEVLLLRNNTTVSRSSPVASQVNTRRGAQNASIDSFESAEFVGESPARAAASDTVLCAPRTAFPPAEIPTSVTLSPARQQRAYAEAAASRPAAPQPANGGIREPIRRTVPSDKVQSDKQSFITVERKKKKPIRQNKCGTAPTGQSSTLRSEIPSSLIYVSRVHYTVKAEDVAEYLRVKSKFSLRVERLESRHRVSFNSFVVRVPTEHLSTFMREDLWPEGIVYRRFRGRLPNPVPASLTQRNLNFAHATPLLRDLNTRMEMPF